MPDTKPFLGGSSGQAKGKILVVDDEIDIVRLLTFALQADGYQVLAAKNGPEGLEKARGQKPDIVILDVMMPGMDGFEVCNELRSKPETATLPIIMLSALGQVSDRVKGLRAGADDYVPKPVNLDELSARVAALLSRTQRQPPTPTSAARGGKIISFIGAKGGVGTTTVALNLAALLAMQKKNVILAEMRGDYGSVASHLKVGPTENLAQLMNVPTPQIDERALSRRLMNSAFGVRVLFGPQRVDEFGVPHADAVKDILKQLGAMAEYVLLDLPPGTSPATEAAIRMSDLVAVVMENDPTSVQAARITLDLLKTWGASGSLVCAIISNRSGLTSGANLRDIKTQLGCEIVGVVPFASEACVAALGQGVPLTVFRPDNIAAMTLKEMASRIMTGAVVGIRL